MKDERDIEAFLEAAQEEGNNDPRIIGEVLRAVAVARELNAAELQDVQK